MTCVDKCIRAYEVHRKMISGLRVEPAEKQLLVDMMPIDCAQVFIDEIERLEKCRAELDSKLKRACAALREAEGRMHGYSDKTFGDLAEELEAMPEEEK